jgi:hypothetical protein
VALEHYTASLEKLLTDCGAAVTSVALIEPSAPGQTRWRWVRQYVAALRAAIPGKYESHPIVIQTWPLLGYWDYAIARLMLRRAPTFIVLHDPRPLVRAKGYGRCARWIASRRVVAAKAVVHSDIAKEVVCGTTKIHDVIDLPHPMFAPRLLWTRSASDVTVRVLGQYKADRDLDAMEGLAARGPSEWRYEVIGRGWPAVVGWKVTDRFVEEGEFDRCLQESDVIVIPYSRFFQSGVAIRALEVGTPVVGPRCSSLADLLGSQSRWLVEESSWIGAVRAAIAAEPSEVQEVAASVYDNVFKRWAAWLRSVPLGSS